VPKGKDRPTIKDDDKYEALRDQGMSKQKAARIVNAGDEASRRGGRSRPYEEWTKKQLYDKAKEVGLEGRSHMDKGELIYALRHN
jgi:hypothetical protein